LEGFLCVVDDSASAASSMEVTDRIASLEQRVQMQEDEIQLLKSALADVVRRLNVSEEQQAMLNRKGPTKGTTQTLSIGQCLIMIILHPTSPPCPAPALSNLTTSPVVTVQIYLHRPSKRTGSTEPPKSASAVPSQSTNTPSEAKVLSERAARLASRKVPPFTLPLRKCTSQFAHSPLDMPSYRNEGYVKMYLKGRPITMYMPRDLVDTYCLEAKADLPPKKLKLDWVYGYRGRDCRSNLYLLPTGETVYFIASVVVLYNVDEQLQRHYTGHTDDIKCLAVHPDKITIATGQVAGTSSDGKLLAPHVRVWDSVSLNTLHILGTGFFDRALVCLSFSKSNGGSWLCVVDDSNDHILSVWDWQREERLAEVKCSNESVFVADFHPTDANVIVTCGKSHLYFWSLEKGSLVKKQGLFEKQEKPKFVLCVTFSENGDAITGDSSGNILVWGKGKRIKGSNRISLAIQGAHEASVFALCMLRNGTLVSGGKDRKLISWDENYQKIQTVPELYGPIRTVAEGRGETVLIGTTKNYVLQGSLDGEFIPITQGHTDELWGLTVHPLKHQFLTCGHDKHVCLWDSASHQPIWTKTLETCEFNTVLSLIINLCRWLVLDTESKDLVTVHTDGNEQLSVMRFSPDGHFLAIGSHDNYIYIYAVAENGKKYSRVGKCSGHSSFITHLDWSVDSQYLVSNSGDYEILYWIPSVCKQVVSVETTRDIEWATFTCTLGFHVFGLWPDGSDGTDINAVCSSNAKRLLVTGDDFGKVHLFSFPCCQSRAPSHIYGGHSSHVTNVNFLQEDSHLISTGGKDMSVMQWRVLILSLTSNLFCASTSLTKRPHVVHIYIRVKLHFLNLRLRNMIERLQLNDCSINNKTKHAQACL
uniref:EMAP like 1 n=1 Tax=Cyprinus carpio TaxID=7962 RepID=A0A8C1WMX2_CYPCA